jgi:Mrp family chromosome partitioning ATPase
MLEKTLVMRGTLGDVEPADLLQVLATCRQLTSVEFSEHEGRAAISLLLKSGKIVGVSPAEHDVEATLRELFENPHECRFVVFRLPDPEQLSDPIGSLSQVLLEMLSSPASERAAPQPQATAPAAVFGRTPSQGGPPASPILAVCSPKGGAGKTTIALNLAVALARTGVNVLLFDVDPNGDVLSALDAHGSVEQGIY